MATRASTALALRAWRTLSAGQQAEAAAWAARHLNRHLRRYRARFGRGVLKFAAGMRESREDRRKAAVLVPETVLVVLVRKKWSRSEERRARPAAWIPESIMLRVPIPPEVPRHRSRRAARAEADPFGSAGLYGKQGRGTWSRRIVAIPTDVSVLGKPRSQAGEAQRLFALNAGLTKAAAGVPCALVKTAGSAHRYLLTCHHVAFRSDTDPRLAPDRTARIHTGRTQGNQFQRDQEIGSPVGRSLLKAGLTNQLDAGLVGLNAAGVGLVQGGAYLRVRPTSWVQNRANWLAYHAAANPKPTLVLDPGGGRAPVHLEFLRHDQNRSIAYKSGATASIVEVFVLRCRGGSTAEGYSGAPITLTTPGGIVGLVAMHIAGETIGGVAYSYAIPAYWLLPANLLLQDALQLA